MLTHPAAAAGSGAGYMSEGCPPFCRMLGTATTRMPAAVAAATPAGASSITRQAEGGRPSRCATAMKQSGAGLPFCGGPSRVGEGAGGGEECAGQPKPGQPVCGRTAAHAPAPRRHRRRGEAGRLPASRPCCSACAPGWHAALRWPAPAGCCASTGGQSGAPRPDRQGRSIGVVGCRSRVGGWAAYGSRSTGGSSAKQQGHDQACDTSCSDAHWQQRRLVPAILQQRLALQVTRVEQAQALKSVPCA